MQTQRKAFCRRIKRCIWRLQRSRRQDFIEEWHFLCACAHICRDLDRQKMHLRSIVCARCLYRCDGDFTILEHLCRWVDLDRFLFCWNNKLFSSVANKFLYYFFTSSWIRSLNINTNNSMRNHVHINIGSIIFTSQIANASVEFEESMYLTGCPTLILINKVVSPLSPLPSPLTLCAQEGDFLGNL